MVELTALRCTPPSVVPPVPPAKPPVGPSRRAGGVRCTLRAAVLLGALEQLDAGTKALDLILQFDEPIIDGLPSRRCQLRRLIGLGGQKRIQVRAGRPDDIMCAITIRVTCSEPTCEAPPVAVATVPDGDAP
jgi:hypothetical protein